jgi:hypothetical protein
MSNTSRFTFEEKGKVSIEAEIKYEEGNREKAIDALLGFVADSVAKWCPTSYNSSDGYGFRIIQKEVSNEKGKDDLFGNGGPHDL